MARESLAAIDPARILFIKPSSLGGHRARRSRVQRPAPPFPAAGISWLVFEEFAGIVEQLPGLGEAIVADRRGDGEESSRWSEGNGSIWPSIFRDCSEAAGWPEDRARRSVSDFRIRGKARACSIRTAFSCRRGRCTRSSGTAFAAEALGGRFDPAAGTLPVTPGAKEKVDNIFREARIEGGAPLVGLAPGAAGRRRDGRRRGLPWPAGRSSRGWEHPSP